MSCSICTSKTHNKRKCPEKDKVVEPQPKRSRGRPRKQVHPEVNSTNHHAATTQPSRLGSGGRVIHGRGVSRGGRGRTSEGRGRGRGQVLVGYGVVVDNEGHTWINSPGQHGGPT
ncbi:unnamed protein product, partial [Cuscuta europaea]